MHTLRHRILRRLHCWLALPLALFLIVLGLTGSAITWMHELDVWLNPSLLQVAVNDTEQSAPLKTSALLHRLNDLPGYASPSMLELPEKKNEVAIAWYKIPKQDKSDTQMMRQVMLHPYTGAIIGERNWGETGFTGPLLMPTLFHLHRQLLAGEIGKTIVSINAILLTVIALSGIYLWWPVWRLKAWWSAITVSHMGSWKRFNFRLHRAAGFYIAPLFLMLALTGIYLNKPQWILSMVPVASKPVVPSSNWMEEKILPLEEILHIAQQQFPLARISRVSLPKSSNAVYEIRLHQPGELRQRTGATRVSVDGVHGTIIKIQDPLKAKKWDLLFSYFFPLHSGEIAGLIGKIIISVTGLMPLLFAISGTIIWLRRK